MKVLLVWENSAEEEVAERCARVAHARIREIAQTLTTRLNMHIDSIPISSRALSFRELVSAVAMEQETREYVTALEKAVFVDGGAL